MIIIGAKTRLNHLEQGKATKATNELISEVSKKDHLLTKLSYPLNSFDRLNHLEQGKATNELISLVSLNVVQCGMRVYRILRDIKEEILPITQENLQRASKALELPKANLWRLITVDPKIARRITYADLIKPIPHRPADFCLHILIVYLRRHIAKIKARPGNALISEFLSEQGITDKYSPDRISKIARTDLKILEAIYNVFFEIYEAPGGREAPDLDTILRFDLDTRRLAVDEPMSERDIVFPSWENFMP